MHTRRISKLAAVVGGVATVLSLAAGAGHPTRGGFPAPVGLLLGLADGETFNDGLPVSCSAYNVVSP